MLSHEILLFSSSSRLQLHANNWICGIIKTQFFDTLNLGPDFFFFKVPNLDVTLFLGFLFVIRCQLKIEKFPHLIACSKRRLLHSVLNRRQIIHLAAATKKQTTTKQSFQSRQRVLTFSYSKVCEKCVITDTVAVLK